MTSTHQLKASARSRWGAALHHPSQSHGWARRFNLMLSVLILANVVAVVIDTMPSLSVDATAALDWFEKFSFSLFAIEYLVRVWTCVELARFSPPVRGRLRYMVGILPLIDLAVLLSFFAPFDLRFLRLVRIVRLLRVLHLQQYEEPLQAIGAAIAARRQLLVIAVVAMMMLMFFAAAGMYFIEHDVQPTVFSSIPAAMWWAVMTLTTVGYGDVLPVTPLGKFFAAVIATGGIAVFAMPMAIVTAAILEVDVRAREETENRQNELLTDTRATHGKPVDTRATRKAGASNPRVATVETGHRATKRCR